MISLKTVAVAAVGAVGASLITMSANGAAASRNASEVVVTSAQDVATKGGYVFYDDGTKLYVNARCKADIVEAGSAVRVADVGEIKARSNVPELESERCAKVVSDLLTEPATIEAGATDSSSDTPASPDEATSRIVLYVTSGTSSPTKGGFVVTDGQTWTHVGRKCKASLLTAGIPTRDAVWRDVDEFTRDQSFTCDRFEQWLDETPPPVTPSRPGWVRVGDEVGTAYRDGRERERYFLFDPDDHDDPTWDASRIGWLVECESVKFAHVDPMVSPGSVSHHLHEFFGNGNVSSLSTTQDFVDTPRDDIECTDVNDKSAYWSPAAFQDGRRLTARLFKAYYKSPTPDVVPMPLGLRMVAGDAAATGNQDRLVGWFEEQRTDDLTPKEDLSNTVGASEMITRRNPGVNLVLRVNFPNCWDGVHLDSADHQSHVAYFDEDTLTCPGTHPVRIAQLTTFTQYDTDGGAGFSLASGEWYTFHQDFWNAWSPDQMAELNDKCIRAELNCRIKGSNALKKRGQYWEYVPELT